LRPFRRLSDTVISALTPRGLRTRLTLLVVCAILPGFALALYESVAYRSIVHLGVLAAAGATALIVTWWGSRRLILDPLESGQAEAQRATDSLRALAARIEDDREEERTAIAREIHDQLGQNLTAIRMDIDWLSRALEKPRQDDPKLARKLLSMAELLDATVPLVRDISRRLRPGVLDALGLRAALEWLLEDFGERAGLKTAFACDVDDSRLGPDRATVLFRITQESLTNIARHARARYVTLHLGPEADGVILELFDDGRGFAVEQLNESPPRSLGILGMRERAHSVGGRFSITSIPGQGTTVSAWVPFSVDVQHGRS
jgi:signal transduction histidine kinase